MPLIPADLIATIKREKSCVEILEAAGHQFKPHGKDVVCRCPWHDDKQAAKREQLTVPSFSMPSHGMGGVNFTCGGCSGYPSVQKISNETMLSSRIMVPFHLCMKMSS